MISDSSLRGFGVILGKDWLAGTWPNVPQLDVVTTCHHIGAAPAFGTTDYSNINELELWPILLGLHRWYPLLRNKTLHLLTDNTQVMGLLKKGTSTNATCMDWVREIFWICVIHNIQLLPDYISTEDNVLADALSGLPYGKALNCETISLMNELCCSDALVQFTSRLGIVGYSSPLTDSKLSVQGHPCN